MTDFTDPAELRMLAAEHIRAAATNIDHGDVLDSMLGDPRFAHLMVGDEDDDIATLDPIAAEILDQAKVAIVTVTWPEGEATS